VSVAAFVLFIICVISFDSIGPYNGDSIVMFVLFIYLIIKKDSSGRGVQHYVIKFVSDLR